jgi:hypothetical protein
MSAFIGKGLRRTPWSSAAGLVVVLLLAACQGFPDEGGVNSVELPPTEAPDDGPALEIPAIPLPGASVWQAGRSGDYDYFSAQADDVDHDAHDCVLNDLSIGGLDLHQVQASVWHDPNGPSWFPEFTIIMYPPADASPDELVEWAIQLQNSLGILLINQWGEMDGDEFDGPLPESSLWSSPDTGEMGVSLRPGPTYSTPGQAAQALVPWFQGLQVSIRTEAPGGAVCDEMVVSAAKSR